MLRHAAATAGALVGRRHVRAFLHAGGVKSALGGADLGRAGRAHAKKIKNTSQPDRPDVGRIMVGQNTEKATRY